MTAAPRRARTVVTAQEAALNELRERIGRGFLHPGQQLRQESLATEMGLSVVPVREALKILETEGQVVYTPHRGYFVAQLDLTELTEAYRIRELLEDEAVTRGVPMLVKEDITRMKEAIRDIDRSGNDILSVNAANRRFHFTIFDAADMPRLANFIRILWETTEPYRSLYIADAANRRQINDEHRAILAAVCDRDVSRVISLLHAHRDNAIECVTGVLQVEDAADTSP